MKASTVFFIAAALCFFMAAKAKGAPSSELIVGGLADGKTIEDLAVRHGVSVDFINAQLATGIAVEMEHTSNPAIAREIALDHLWEDAYYYEKLRGIEEH